MSTYLRAPPNSHEKNKHEFKKPEVTQKYKQPEIEKKKSVKSSKKLALTNSDCQYNNNNQALLLLIVILS